MIVRSCSACRWSRCGSCSPTPALVPRGDRHDGVALAADRGHRALHKASEEVLAKAKQLAAHLLEASADDIVLHDGGKVGVAGVPARRADVGRAAPAAGRPGRPDDWPTGAEAALARSRSTSTRARRRTRSAPHVAVVEVDTETGAVELLRHIAVDDCGRILNPLLVAGQQHGGIAQGVAQALYEGVVYDDDGNPLTGEPHGLRDAERGGVPSFEAVEHRDADAAEPARREGHRRVGHDRLDAGGAERGGRRAVSHLGVRHIDMPLHGGAGVAGDPGRARQPDPDASPAATRRCA